MKGNEEEAQGDGGVSYTFVLGTGEMRVVVASLKMVLPD